MRDKSIATTYEGVRILVRGRRALSSRRRRGHRQHRVSAHPQHKEHEEQLQPSKGAFLQKL